MDADISKRKPDQILDDIIQYARLRDVRKVGLEAVQFQEFLVLELEKRQNRHSVHFRVERIRPTGDKIARIQNLQPFIATGKLRFARPQRLLLEQLQAFPKGAHDDGPDALEMAVSLIRRIVEPNEPGNFMSGR